ncbi:MAG: sulfite exporter TauE/SafE family protein [Thermoplasmatota archaeon]
MLENLVDVAMLLAFGFGAGLFVGTASGTAGSILIPSFTLLIGYTAPDAIGTSLAVDCIIGAVAGAVYLRNRHVDIRPTVLLVAAGLAGTLLGSRFTAYTPEAGLKVILGCFLVAVGVLLIKNGAHKNIGLISHSIQSRSFMKHKTAVFLALGFLVGIISGFIGMGGGRMLALILIFIMGYQIHTAIGTSLILMFFIAGTGAASHAFNGEIVCNAVIPTGIAAAAGALVSAHFANRINEDTLARVVGVIILGLGVVLIVNLLI